jgi:hypothetical protein
MSILQAVRNINTPWLPYGLLKSIRSQWLGLVFVFLPPPSCKPLLKQRVHDSDYSHLG